MKLDLDSTEIVFAQKLASGEPRIRLRAMNRLRKWIDTRILKEFLFTKEDLLKLWKGLYYCIWMQDKPLIQEELADNICGLLSNFKTVEQRFLYYQTYLETVGREWSNLDRWRMDKYLMLFRRFVRSWLNWLKVNEWTPSRIKKTFLLWKQNVWSTNSTYPDGLKFHFASIYLDELDSAGKGDLQTTHITQFLIPYMDILKDKDTSEPLFTEIVKEIFETILVNFSEELNTRMEADDDNDSNQNDAIEFDYKDISKRLFKIAKNVSVSSERRRYLYDLVKKFESAANGNDPFEQNLSDVGSDLDQNEISAATLRLVRQGDAVSDEKRKKRRKRKIERLDDLVDDQGHIVPKPRIKKGKKVKKYA